MMKYYIYFDAYGQAKCVINEDELKDKFGGNPANFLKAMGGVGPQAKVEEAAGRVVSLNFENETELEQYLEQYVDVIRGFYDCDSESRPYNF